MPNEVKQYRFQELNISHDTFVEKALHWANQHQYFAYFNSNDISYPHQGFRHLLGIGTSEVRQTSTQTIEVLRDIEHSRKWWMGALTYNLKNEFEVLRSSNPSTIPSDHMHFFKADIVIEITKDGIKVLHENVPFNPALICDLIVPTDDFDRTFSPTAKLSKDTYLKNVEYIKHRIEEGDYYEINYCQEFTVSDFYRNPIDLYLDLNDRSPMPFSGMVKLDHKVLISASPERFLKKENRKLISQPIKGTTKRSDEPDQDIAYKHHLRHSEKERAENMMIVDLVRNDLARVAAIGTVHVEEMFGIYSFKHVHQMISTISAILKSECNLPEIIKATFPMGSMTGAPKIRVMEEIESLENTDRGFYSGAMGYIMPNQDFDFNVIIRSIILDLQRQQASFHVGSAITYDSDPEQEYQECMLKAYAMMKSLANSSHQHSGKFEALEN